MSRTGVERLFAYGTLMFAPVFRAVCGQTRPTRPAALYGYARYRVRGHEFPGLVPEHGAWTEGVLIEGIDMQLWRLLDAFESDFYQRLPVSLGEDAMTVAQTYVVVPGQRHLLEPRAWSAQEFEQLQLAAYLARHV